MAQPRSAAEPICSSIYKTPQQAAPISCASGPVTRRAGNGFAQRHARGRRLYRHSVVELHYRQCSRLEYGERYPIDFRFRTTSWNPGTNANSQQVVIRVTGQSAHLLWSGTADATTWDLKTTQNWKNSDNANATDKFFNGDFVTFDDTGAPNFNISLGGTVQPGSITVNNSAGDYTITGGGSITGGGTLVKNGSRALTISTNNSYSGGATLNAGTLNVNNNGALGVRANH